jgi:hypothetical protein
MAQVQNHDVVSADYRGPDRRRSGVLRLERWIIALVHSRWIAAFVTALVVSWCFHVLETRSDRKLERQQHVVICVIDGVEQAQQGEPSSARISIRPILEGCQEHRGK